MVTQSGYKIIYYDQGPACVSLFASRVLYDLYSTSTSFLHKESETHNMCLDRRKVSVLMRIRKSLLMICLV